MQLHVFALLTIAAISGGAATPGSDDFNDNSPDPTRWLAPFRSGGTGRLAEMNSRLEYGLTTAATTNDFAEHKWLASAGGFGEDWSATADVHVGSSVPAAGQSVSLQLIVRNSAFPLDFLFLNLGEGNQGTGVTRASVCSYYAGSGMIATGSVATTAVDACLRLRYVAGMSTIHAEFSTGGGPYQVVAAANVAGWTRAANARLEVGLLGISKNLALPSGRAYFDNYTFTIGTPPPALRMDAPVVQGPMVSLSWVGGTGPFQLQTRSNLATGLWQNLGNPTALRSAVVARITPAGFYRVCDQGAP